MNRLVARLSAETATSVRVLPRQALEPRVLETAELDLLLQSRPPAMPEAARQQIRAAARREAKRVAKVLRRAQKRKATAQYPAGIKPVISNKAVLPTLV